MTLAARMAQTASSARKACRRSAIRPAIGPHTSRSAVAPPRTSPSSSGPSPRPARKAGKKGEAHPNALKSAEYNSINRSRTGYSTAMDVRFSRACATQVSCHLRCRQTPTRPRLRMFSDMVCVTLAPGGCGDPPDVSPLVLRSHRWIGGQRLVPCTRSRNILGPVGLIDGALWLLRFVLEGSRGPAGSSARRGSRLGEDQMKAGVPANFPGQADHRKGNDCNNRPARNS